MAETVLVLGRNGLAVDLAARLAASRAPRRIVCALTTPSATRDVVTLNVLARGAGRRLTELLHETSPSVLVHAASSESPLTPQQPWDYDQTVSDVLVAGMQRWKEQGGRPEYLIVLSSTAVYGLSITGPLLFAETFRGEPSEPAPGSIAARWARGGRQVEATMRALAETLDCPLATLRAAPVVGAPSVTSPVAQYLAANVAVRAAGYDPPVQVIHYDDLLEALRVAVDERPAGTLNVVGRGAVRLSRLAASAGRLSAPLPAAVADRLVCGAWGPARLRWRCIADGRRVRQVLGFEPRYDAEGAVRESC